MTESPTESLARVLYEEFERLAPSPPERLSHWEKIGEWERSLYVNCVERLLEERELLNRAMADNNPRQSETFEEFEAEAARRFPKPYFSPPPLSDVREPDAGRGDCRYGAPSQDKEEENPNYAPDGRRRGFRFALGDAGGDA